MDSSRPPNDWESLTRYLRRLEVEIQSDLVSFGYICMSGNHSSAEDENDFSEQESLLSTKLELVRVTITDMIYFIFIVEKRL